MVCVLLVLDLPAFKLMFNTSAHKAGGLGNAYLHAKDSASEDGTFCIGSKSSVWVYIFSFLLHLVISLFANIPSSNSIEDLSYRPTGSSSSLKKGNIE